MKWLTILCAVLTLNACSKTEKQLAINSDKSRVLFVVSNQHTYGDTSINAANHFGEIVYAYNVINKHNIQVDFVSPNGGAVPIGYLNTSDSIHKKYIYDVELMHALKTTKNPKEINHRNYTAIYYVGGGAAMFGVPENEDLQKIAMDIYKNDGVLSAVCHGTAGIVNIKDDDGNYIYKGKMVNGFPDAFENKKGKYYETFPFSIEEIITKRGGDFSYSKKGWDNYFLVDGRLITGQDPTGAASVAKEIIKQIK